MKPIVVKIGGSVLGSEDTSLEDLVSLQQQGIPVVVVHGGGKAISEWQEKLGIPSQFIKGLRVTDERSLPVVIAVLAGLVNKELVAQVNKLGGKAIGISGLDGRLMEAQIEDESLGYVGKIAKVNPHPLHALLQAGYIPFIAPIGFDINKNIPLNINADIAAGEIASALKAEKLIFLTDVPGVLDDSGKPLPSLSPEEARGLIASGVISSGMLPKIEACLQAINSGTISRIIDGRKPHILLQEIEGKGEGTTIKG